MSAVTAHDSRADFLEAVPIFAGLPREMRSALAARASWVRVPAGEWLFRQGEPGESLYVVRSGRLEICSKSDARNLHSRRRRSWASSP